MLRFDAKLVVLNAMNYLCALRQKMKGNNKMLLLNARYFEDLVSMIRFIPDYYFHLVSIFNRGTLSVFAGSSSKKLDCIGRVHTRLNGVQRLF